MRVTIGAMKTIYRDAEDNILSPSSELNDHWYSLTYSIQIKVANEGISDTKLEFLYKCRFTLKQNRILKKYQVIKTFKVQISSRED